MLPVAREYQLGIAAPIRINAFASNLYPGQIERSGVTGMGAEPVNMVCLELLQRGYRLLICTLDPAVKTECVLVGPRLRIIVGPYRRRRAWDFFRQERTFLAGAIRRERPAIVHAHWTYEFALGALESGVQTIVTAHDAPIRVLRYCRFAPYRVVRAVMAFWALRKAKHITAVSPYIAEHLTRYHFCTKPVRVIPNGLPEEAFATSKRKSVSLMGFVFATVLQGWGPLKNPKSALRAFAWVRRHEPTARLVMFGIGHGPGEDAEQWADRHNLSGNVRFVGLLPHARLRETLQSEVDALVHPSLEESHGMAIIECMALGIPVIGGDRSGAVPWTLANGEAGLLADVTRPFRLGEAMLKLLRDENLRRRLGDSGRNSARARFHIRSITDCLEDTYSDVLMSHSVLS
jgi:L-malate glycosyltransferase